MSNSRILADIVESDGEINLGGTLKLGDDGIQHGVHQQETTLLTGIGFNGPVWKVRYDAVTANRYIDFGQVDGLGNWSSGLKLYNNENLTWLSDTKFWVSSIGQVHVGTNNSSLYNTTTETGVVVEPDGSIQIAKDNNYPLYLNRRTGDGGLIYLAYNGSAKGAIGISYSSDTYLSNFPADTGVLLNGNGLIPCGGDGIARSSTDSIDIGQNSNPFKDGWFAGTVNAGGLDVITSGAKGIVLRRDQGDSSISARLFLDSSVNGLSLLNVNGSFSFQSGALPGITSGSVAAKITGSGEYVGTKGSFYLNGGVQLSVGRTASERIDIQTIDREVQFTHVNDEGTGSHGIMFTHNTPAPDKYMHIHDMDLIINNRRTIYKTGALNIHSSATYAANYTWSTAWSTNFQTIVPTGVLSSSRSYLVHIFTDSFGAPPYYAAAVFIFATSAGTNGGSADGNGNTYYPLTSHHVSSPNSWEIRTITASNSTNGLCARFAGYTGGNTPAVYVRVTQLSQY